MAKDPTKDSAFQSTLKAIEHEAQASFRNEGWEESKKEEGGKEE
jgi:hypothetical protein